MACRFTLSDEELRPMGRTARGVRAIALNDGDEVVGMAVIRENGYVLTVSETGYGRLSVADDYRTQNRGGKGLVNYHTEKYGDVAAIKVIDYEDDIILIAEDGVIIRIQASSIRVCSRPAKGVRVMKIGEGNRIATLSRAPHDEEEVSKDAVIEDDGSDAEPETEEANEE